jgi:hypothetical protein
VYKTERETRHWLYIDGLKLLGRDEDDLENEIKIVKEISKDIIMNSLLKKLCKHLITM